MRKLQKTVIFLLCFSAITGTVDAFFNPEKIFVKNVNLEHGLSQCVVTDLAVDQQGFLWIGTYDGLNRFDGDHLTLFKHIPNDTNSLPSSKIFKLFADQHFHLWVRTPNGISVFDTRTARKIIPDFLKTQNLGWLCKNDEKSVWVYVKSKGLMLVNTNTFEYTLYDSKGFQFPDLFEEIDVYKIGDEIFIVGSSGDLIQFKIARKQFALIKNNLTKEAVYDNSGLDKYGNIYFGSQQADMMFYDLKEAKFSSSSYYNQNSKLISVRSIQFDATNNVLLLGTNGQGLFVYDYGALTLKQYKKNGEGLSLSSNYIQRIISDNNGVIYIGYDGMGLDVLDPFIKKFVTIKRNDPDDLKSLRFVRKIVEDDDGNLLMGTSGSGLVKFNMHDRTFDFYNTKNVNESADNFIIDMIRVENELWLGYNGSGIDIMDIRTLKKTYHIGVGTEDNQISDGVIWSFLNDQQGNIWVGTRANGLNKINVKTRKVQQFTKADYPGLSTGMRCMNLLKNGHILLGTEDGLFEVNPTTNSVVLVYPRDNNPNSIKSFKSIFLDYKDRIWLCTDGSGLLVLDQHYNFLNNFNSTNSLNSDVVYGILPENDSSFWISSNSGISSIQWNETSLQPNGKILTYNYDEKNGLQSNEFNTGAYITLKNGKLAFGGLYGVNVFDPKEIKNNQIVPVTYIREFKVFENVLKGDTLVSYMSAVNLNHFENSFSVTFGTIGFSLPGKTKYRYRLVGNDNAWIDADTRNYVSYTNLTSGHYEFQVKACNYDGVWNENYTSLSIFIATPFYKTWWFSLLILALVSQLVYLVYRNKQRIAREKEELKIIHTKEIAEVEMKALRAQINPHFLFNSLNSINSYILKNDNKLASRYLVKFSQLVRNILNHSSTAYITLSEELNTIDLYMRIEGMRFNNQFSYLVDLDPEINTANIQIPSLLLQPYVENAIWHGLLHKEGEKNITIRVRKQSMESVCIEIEDNGVGRKMAAEIEQKPQHRKSFGMQLGESRLKLMNDGENNISSVGVIDKYDNLHQPSGTIIRIIIPSKIFIDEKISLN